MTPYKEQQLQQHDKCNMLLVHGVEHAVSDEVRAVYVLQ